MRDALPPAPDRTRLTPPRIRIVGCGRPDAGDDAAGLLIAERLRKRLPPEVEVRTDTAGGANLLHWCDDVEVLILADAALATDDFPTGQWRRFAFPADRDRVQAVAFAGTHTLGVVQGLELASTLGRLPGEVLLYAVAGARFELGAALSPAVKSSIATVADQLAVEMPRRLSARRPVSGCELATRDSGRSGTG